MGPAAYVHGWLAGWPQVVDEKETTVYKRAVEAQYQLKMKASRAVLSEINQHYPTMPFTMRALLSGEKDGLKASELRLGMVECLNHGLLHPYPVLHEKVRCVRCGAGRNGEGSCSPHAAPHAAPMQPPCRPAVQPALHRSSCAMATAHTRVGPGARRVCVPKQACCCMCCHAVECASARHGCMYACVCVRLQSGELVAQIKGTVLLMANGSSIVTKAPEVKVESEKKVRRAGGRAAAAAPQCIIMARGVALSGAAAQRGAGKVDSKTFMRAYI